MYGTAVSQFLDAVETCFPDESILGMGELSRGPAELVLFGLV